MRLQSPRSDCLHGTSVFDESNSIFMACDGLVCPSKTDIAIVAVPFIAHARKGAAGNMIVIYGGNCPVILTWERSAGSPCMLYDAKAALKPSP